MNDQHKSLVPPIRPENHGAEVRISLALTIVWLLACTLYLVVVPGAFANVIRDVVGVVFLVVAAGFPLVLIWTVSYVAGSIRSIRTEATVLRQSMEQIKYVLEHSPNKSDSGQQQQLQKQLEAIASLTQQTDKRLTELATKALAITGGVATSRVGAAALVAQVDEGGHTDQKSLALSGEVGPERVPISVVEFIKALNFPDNAEDREGFRVLRRAFEERQLGKLLRASQDVLTLLSQDGIYMDDLNPDKPLPNVWRKFARGERGLSVTALGGIRDRSALTLAKARLKNDPIFRDATHHFLRQYDKILVDFEKTAEDGELLEMSETRSARAFMLLGRVAGSFD